MIAVDGHHFGKEITILVESEMAKKIFDKRMI